MKTYVNKKGHSIRATNKAYDLLYRNKGYLLVSIDDGNLINNISKYHKGAGYYEFPNGIKIRGREKAEEYLTSWLNNENEVK